MVTFNRLNADPDITGSDQVPVYDSGSNRLRKGTMTQIAEFVRTSLGLANELVEEAPDDNFIYGRQNKAWITINKDDAGRVVPLIAPRQTGDGVKLEFDSPIDYAADPRGFFVEVDGITQRPTSPNSVADYSINDNGKVVFTEAVPDGAIVDVRFFQPSTDAVDRTLDTVIADGATAARTLGSRARDIINIKDFGAVGDGVADDTTAIQAAIDYAATVVRNTSVPTVDIVTCPLYLPSGRYKVTTLEIKNGVRMYGESRSSTVIVHTGANPAIFTEQAEYKHGISIEKLSILGDSTLSTHGVELYRCIRSCYMNDVLIDGFQHNYYLRDSWTFKLLNCQGQGQSGNNVDWSGATAGLISGCRFDTGLRGIYIHNAGTDTENLTIVDTAAQATQKAGIRATGIENINVIRCFVEACAQDNVNDEAYIHLDMNGQSIAKVEGNYINKGSSGSVGLAACNIGGVKEFTFSENHCQSQTTGLIIASNVEAGSVLNNQFATTTNRYINNSTGVITIKEGVRPTIHYGVDMTNTFDGLIRSSLVAGLPNSGYVALGARNGIPTVQGAGSGSNFRLLINPHDGDVEIAYVSDGKVKLGSTILATSVTSSNITVLPSHRVLAINASGGNRTVTIPASEEENGRLITIKKTDASSGASNRIIISPNSTIEGAATYDIDTAYGKVDIMFIDGQWYIV